MTRRKLPRYFVSRADAPSHNNMPEEILSPAHIIDSFFIGSRHLEEREWIVATDGLGGLLMLPDAQRTSFTESAQHELAFNEISNANGGRLIEAAEVFLFDLQLLEQPAGAQGWNDPVYLYGRLYGPYPESADKPQPGVEGQLTVTRCDLLQGIVDEAASAFRYAGTDATAGQSLRCFRLLLPGDTEEEIRRGVGVILAYPLLPAELTTADVSNEIVVSQLLYDLLSALKEDLEREQLTHPLRQLILPVPSRALLEQQLLSQGYEIKGDNASKKVDSGAGFKGFLASVFGALMDDTLKLPPEAEVDEFLDIARRTLAALPGWPSVRAVALRNCVKLAPARRKLYSAPPPLIRTPQLSAPLPAVHAPQPTRRSSEPPEWMKDFISAHQRPNAMPPRLTSTTGLKRHTVPTKKVDSPQTEPEWIKDFEQAPPARQANDAKRQRQSNEPGKPGWMDDFE